MTVKSAGSKSPSQCGILKFYRSSIGKKSVVALTGLIMVLWLVGHLLGNLQVFAGSEADPALTKINAYAAFLKANLVVLWTVRLGMLGVIALHILTVIQLTRLNQSARPESYHTKKKTVSTFASSIMMVGGLIVLSYLIYHILHFTVGVVHPNLLDHQDLYQSMINSFQNPLVVALYLVGQTFLYFHLSHGIQSTFRTLGVSKDSYVNMGKTIGCIMSLIITLGFSSIPLAIFFGLVS